MIKHYILITIGPVQEFIAASRKTVDLFSGSALLSSLIEAGIKEIGKQGNVLFPVINNQNNKSLPNRIFFSTEDSKPEDFAELVSKRIKEKFDDISKDVKERFSGSKNTKFQPDWDSQVNNFLEVYYIIYTPKQGDTYSEIYNAVEQAMGQRKLLRNFNQLEQPGRKCSLINYYSVVYEESSRSSKSYWEEKQKNKKSTFRPGEQLSSIGIIKRMFLNSSFPSTRAIAAAGYIKRLIEDSLADSKKESKIKTLIEKIRSLESDDPEYKSNNAAVPFIEGLIKGRAKLKEFINLDMEWLDKSSFTTEYLKKNFPDAVVNDKILQAASGALDEIHKLTNYPKHKYYAVIHCDGDEMGKKLSSVKGEDEHIKISNTLNAFTSSLPGIIEGADGLGKIVYAGGDDLLALCPLDNLFTVLIKINAAYHQSFKKDFPNLNATISAGVAVAHHSAHLQVVLNAARQAEKYAKDVLERNAVAFAVLQNNSVTMMSGMKWEYAADDKTHQSLDIMKEWGENVANGNISKSFVYDFEQELPGLLGGINNFAYTMAGHELNRLMKRRTKSAYWKSSGSDFCSKLLTPFWNWLRINHQNPSAADIYQFNHLLRISQFIAKGGNP